MQFENSLEYARQLDAQDELKHFRTAFRIPAHEGREAVYFLGNSLGLQPRHAGVYVQQVLDQWAQWGVEGFFTGESPWLHYHDRLVKPLAKIVGALPEEVVVMNQLTVNLHLMLVSFYQPRGKRCKILCEAKAFPSDQYMLETHLRQRGFDPDEVLIEVQPDRDDVLISEEAISAAIERHKDELALVLWSGVNYYTGQVFDMKRIATAAHAAGALVGFDLAHAAGNINLRLHDWDVDFACWCSYKYLNSGPGAIGGAFIHRRFHNDRSLQRFAGWWGYRKETRFLMQKGFDPITTAEGWQLSTPSPILYAAHRSALDLFEQAGIERLVRKGQCLSDFLIYLLKEVSAGESTACIRILTPADAKGCQVSMLVPKQGKHLFSALTEAGVFADWREPDVIRVAPVPLYNTFEEVWQFARILRTALKKLNG